MFLALVGLVLLVISIVMLVRRDPDAANTWDETVGLVSESYSALRKRELGSLEDQIDDVSLGDFFSHAGRESSPKAS